MTDIIAKMRFTSSIICIVEEGELLSALYFVYFGGDFSEIGSPSRLGSLYFDKVDVLQISRLTVPGSGIRETEAAAAGIVGVHIGFSQVVGVAPGIGPDVAYSVVVAIGLPQKRVICSILLRASESISEDICDKQ